MEIYNKALEAYERSTELVLRLFKVAKAKKVTPSDFSIDKAMENFDVLIQYSMMQVALSDKEFSYKEVKIIEKLSKYCSFVTFLNNLGFKDVTWDKLAFITPKVLQSIMDKIKTNVQNINKDFIEYFTFVDKATPSVDYSKELYEYMIAIMSAVIISDRKWKPSEGNIMPLIIEAITLIKRKKNKK